MKKRTVSRLKLLTSCLLLGSLALVTSCKDTEENPPSPAETAAASDAVTETETAPSRVRADLPEMDFGGETFSFYARTYDGEWTANDIAVHETNGDLVNDALYERTVYIEETCHVTLEIIPSDDHSVAKQVKTAVTAGETAYDAVVCSVYDASGLAANHMFLDLCETEYIDLSKPWWSQMTNSCLSIAGKQYYATGDIFLVDNKGIRIFFFNKGLIAELGLENPYRLVFDNAWTVEKYMELSNAATADLNGDNKMERKADRYGTMAQNPLGIFLYIGAGEHITAKDENDLPYIACNTDRAVSVMTKISDLIRNSDSITLDSGNSITGRYPDNMVFFMEGRALFAPEVLYHIETMRSSEVDVGIVPPPKFDRDQDQYYCYADGFCVNTVSIPITNAAPEKAGYLLEAMAADSANNITPAYYEVALTDKYVRDRESVEMLDLILSSVVMENANVFSWAGMEGALADAMAKSGKIVSTIERRTKTMEKAMIKTVDAFQNSGE